MENEFVYYDRNSSAHIPSADSFSRSRDSHDIAAFPAVSGLTSAQAKQNAIQKKDGNASMPAQLCSGLSYFFLSFFGNNNDEEIDVSKLSADKLLQTAMLLDVDPVELIEHLNQDNIFTNEQRNNFLNAFFAHPQTKHLGGLLTVVPLGLIPPKLIENLEGSDFQKLNTIFERLNNYNFRYTGESNTALDGFISHSGDCHTLVNMFLALAEAAGIKGVKKHTNPDPTLVEKRSVHGRQAKGNVHEKFCWYFIGHHWCTYGGQVFDLLFMSKHLPITREKVEVRKYKNVAYTVFQRGWSFIEADEVEEKLNVHLLPGEMGIVRTGGERGIKNYIDGNLG